MTHKTYWIRKTKDAPVILVPEYEWEKLLRELQRAGYRKAAIARATGLSVHTIDGLLGSSAKWKGKTTEPSWTAGQKILEFVTLARKETQDVTAEV